MPEIHVLKKETIDQIAAGEVVERPASVVKELTENAIDAGAGSLTVEIRDGGLSLIRVTDNGCGIEEGQVRTAFLRHATSKIETVEDLEQIRSFGFRGEALSSIAAVSRVELITKCPSSLTGIRYGIEGGEETFFEEVGAPDGSTFIVRDLFYNTPARRKFLKSPQTEAGYIAEFCQRLALSHPSVSIKFMVNGQTKLVTGGNGRTKDVIYAVYGREISSSMIEVSASDEESGMLLEGFIGKPVISRGNRSYETFFVNGRLVHNNILSKAAEEGYETFLMQHRFPFLILSLTLDGTKVDVNVHPAKSQVRFSDGPGVFEFVKKTVRDALTHRDLVIGSGIERENKKEKKEEKWPEPFEQVRRAKLTESSPYGPMYPDLEERRKASAERISRAEDPGESGILRESGIPAEYESSAAEKTVSGGRAVTREDVTGLRLREGEGNPFVTEIPRAKQVSLFTQDEKGNLLFGMPAGKEGKEAEGSAADSVRPEEDGDGTDDSAGTAQQGQKNPDALLLSPQHVKEHRLVGQLFETYWIIEFRNSMYIIDQHAAHEKVMFERLMKIYREKEAAQQRLSPPLIVTLSMTEESLLTANMDLFTRIGFEISPFGGRDYAISAVPLDLFGLTEREYFLEMLDRLSADTGRQSIEQITASVATMACKAAVKGNTRLTFEEADALISELLTLDNPYNCPHGRPTVISMTRYEIEKKFRRIV